MTIEARFHVIRGAFVLDASFKIPSRGVTAIFGPSGSGKTSLLRAIAGLDRDARVHFQIAGEVWQNENRSIFIPTHKRPLGYVFQEASLFEHLNVRTNLEYGFDRIKKDERKIAFAEAVDLLGLQSLLDRDSANLSGGERQRVAIARALLTSPRLLLMDEPLAGIDAKAKSEILPYLERLHEELQMPVIYVSHVFHEVARLADYLVLMDSGRVLAAGPLVQMLSRLDLPLAHAPDAESVVETVVAGHDESYHLTRLDFPAGQFFVTQVDIPIGHPVRVRVLARDVSVTLRRQTDTSILNILPATIRALSDDAASQATIVLDLGESVSILSRITRKSVAALGLVPGKQVFAQIKGIALLGPGGGAVPEQ